MQCGVINGCLAIVNDINAKFNRTVELWFPGLDFGFDLVTDIRSISIAELRSSANRLFTIIGDELRLLLLGALYAGSPRE